MGKGQTVSGSLAGSSGSLILLFEFSAGHASLFVSISIGELKSGLISASHGYNLI